MNKTVLILLLALFSASAFTQWGGSGGFGNYGGYGGYSQGRWSGGYTGGWGNSADLTGGFDSTGTTASVANGGAYSCPYAIDNANRAFDQLVEDVRGQVNEWIVYSDLDAVDEVSYYLAKSCDVKKLDVVAEGSQACKGLGGLLKAIVQQAETSAFRGGYQEGAKLSEQALGLGKGVEKGCKVRVVKKQQDQQQKQKQKQQNQQGNQKQQKEQIKQKGQEEKTGQSQQKPQVGQKQGSIAKSLDRKFAKISPQNSNKYGQYGNEVGSQLTNKYAGKYTGQYGNNYGKDYIDQGKSMTRLAGNGQGKKYGEDQAALAHKLNKEYTAKYAKGKNNKNEQWKKYQEKYQHNDEEENNLENEEEYSFNLDAMLMDLTWM